ncbi:hypothetical protein L596_020464 [Steinernema carpocapsae]|uniref:Saposin A-type domain-containing protein n=1 Tax=Steinernema carpocapsae TaxID=34508 RepID=A0A4U5MTT5_STECR|nr:hypothetical protein L596_020464 [Steinernema carpocapsae]
MGFFLLLFACLLPAFFCLQCTLPSDFWCDHPEVEHLCTGSSSYCDNYKLSNPTGRLSIKLAFESYCPDSQAFVVDRLYRQFINNPNVSSIVDFKAIPWGLATRLQDGSVACHHRERECVGNRHISCAFQYLPTFDQKNRFLYCFMNHLLYQGRITDGINDCFARVGLASASDFVLQCASGPQADQLQRIDELDTQKILNEPRFVPYLQFGEKSSLHMQYYQVMLAEKLVAMSSTLRIPSRTTEASSKCTTPPDFWCSSGAITNECFSENQCMTFLNGIYGQPVEITVIYDSSSPVSRDYVTNYISKNLLQQPNIKNKVRIKLRSAALSLAEDRACAGRNGTNCHDYAIQECIANKVANKQEISKLLHCLLDSHQTPGDMHLIWASKCHFMQENYNINLKEDVLNCASSLEWRVHWRRRLQMEASLTPEPKSADPWIILNGFSLKSVQSHAHILHRMICAWYRGPGHSRDLCGRCEYEPTHC